MSARAPKVLILVLLLIVPLDTRAQVTPELPPGARIRIETSSTPILDSLTNSVPETGKRIRLVGDLVRLNQDTLALRFEDTDVVAVILRESVTKLEVSRTGMKKSHVLTGGIIGSVVGATVGAIAGNALGEVDCWGESWIGSDKRESCDGMILPGALIGGVAGALIGIAVASPMGEKWDEVPLNSLPGGISCRGGQDFSLLISFTF
jgi:hypothetical protein